MDPELELILGQSLGMMGVVTCRMQCCCRRREIGGDRSAADEDRAVVRWGYSAGSLVSAQLGAGLGMVWGLGRKCRCR